MGLQYDVEIRYLESGNLGGKIGGIGAKLKDLHGDFNGLGSALASGFSGALDVVSDVAKTIAGIGAAGIAGVAVASGAIVHMNDQLEGTQIALASIFQANGASSTFAAGMGLAATQIGKMRKDAADLPGEFDDLVNIFQTIAPNTFRGGMGADATRQLAAQTMAAAAIMRLPMHVAAREMSALIEGRAGAHNILGLRMMGLAGGKAKEFNHLSEEERLKRLSGSMSKLVTPDVLDAFQHSFTGLFSTAKQNFKTLAITFGNPLFESTKGALEKINNWFTANQPKIDAYAHYLGQKLADAFEYGVNWFQQFGPAIFTFATNAVERMQDVWLKMEPVVAKIGNHLKNFLGDPKAIDKLEHFAMMGLALKIGAPMAGALGKSALSAVGGEMSAGGLGTLAELAPVAGTLAAALLVLIAAVYGADEAMHQNTESSWAANSMWIDIKDNMGAGVKGVTGVFQTMSDNIMNTLDPALQNLGISALGATVAMSWLFKKAVDNAPALLSGVPIVGPLLAALSTNWSGTGRMDPHHNTMDPGLVKVKDSSEDRMNKLKTPPTSQTNIQKVEIVVQSNQDPARIARLTMQELLNVKGTRTGFIPKMLGGSH